MKIAPFETEHFFARHEFSTPYQLCNSDCESVTIDELLAMSGDSLENLGRERLGYTESRGHPDLREAIADTYRNVPPEHVTVLGAPIEGIYLVARTLLEPGDEVIVLTPAFDALVNVFGHVAGPDRLRQWRFRDDGTSWTLDLDELRALLTAKTKLIVVNFPHNPTGYLPSAEWQRELAGLVERRGLWLFHDEMYYGLVHSGTAPIPSMADVTDRAVVLSGLSKTYGLPGLRSGWLVARDARVREDLVNWKFYTSICSPVPTEYLARAALRARETIRLRNVARIERNLRVAEAFFGRWPGLFRWRRPLAGSTALVGFDVPSVSALAERLVREEGLLIQSAAMLGFDDRHMRIGLGREGFDMALDRFEHWLQRSPLGRA